MTRSESLCSEITALEQKISEAKKNAEVEEV